MLSIMSGAFRAATFIDRPASSEHDEHIREEKMRQLLRCDLSEQRRSDQKTA